MNTFIDGLQTVKAGLGESVAKVNEALGRNMLNKPGWPTWRKVVIAAAIVVGVLWLIGELNKSKVKEA